MRALFTQLSLLVGLMTIFNTHSGGAPVAIAILWGLSAGCMIYLVLLLGDFTVHRLLEERSHELNSVRFVNGKPSVSLDDIEDELSLADSEDRDREAA